MLTLLNECHFWTTQSEIQINSTDFGAYKYSEKKETDRNDVFAQPKREYLEKKGCEPTLSNRKPTRLKDNLRKLEDFLSSHKISYLEWQDASVVLMLLSNGVLVYICTNIYTGDIYRIAFDKYFVGKLATDVVNDAIFTRQNILLSYDTNQITIVHLQKPNMNRSCPEKIEKMEPKIFHILIPCASQRKLARHLSVNSSFDLVTVWTKSSLKEIYPWKPTVRDHDRANIQIYKIRGAKLETLAYCWTENDPICVEFLKTGDGRMMTVEQKISKKGEVTAEICFYEIGHMKMQRTAVTSIPMGAKISCHSFSPDQEKVFFGTVERYICIYDFSLKSIKFVPKIEITPNRCVWHPDCCVIFVSNNHSQFQCFDMSLSVVGNQILSEMEDPKAVLDLSQYFTVQKKLLSISFSPKPRHGNSYALLPTDCYLLLAYENGPLGCLRMVAGAAMIGDAYNGSGLTADILISKYLAIDEFEKAVNVFLCLNWESYGTTCLYSLHIITNYILTRHDVKRSRNELFTKAVQSFPSDQNEVLEDEFGDQVIDIKRRYFFFLMRNKLFSEAFDIAKIVGDYDLFMDLYNLTISDPNLQSFAQEAFRQAEVIVKKANEADDASVSETHSMSNCSRLSCAECLPQKKPERGRSKSYRTESKSYRTENPKPSKFSQSYLTIRRSQPSKSEPSRSDFNTETYVPPLPYIKPKILNAANVKIDTPKQEKKALIHDNVFKPLTARSHSLIDFKYPKRAVEPSAIKVASNRSSSTQREYKFTIKQDENNRYQVVDLLSTSDCKEKRETQKTETWSHIPDQTLGIPIKNPVRSVGPSFNISSPGASAFAPIQSAHNISRLRYATTTNNNLPNPPPYAPPPGTHIQPHYRPAREIIPQARRTSNSNYVNYSLNNNNDFVAGESSGLHPRDLLDRRTEHYDSQIPGPSRRDKPPIPAVRNGFRAYLTNPQKSLPESSQTNRFEEEFVRNYDSMSIRDEVDTNYNEEQLEEQSESKNGIKVVHFGVV